MGYILLAHILIFLSVYKFFTTINTNLFFISKYLKINLKYLPLWN